MLQRADTRAALESVKLASFDGLLAAYTTGPGELRDFIGPGPILTDDRPMLEYYYSVGKEAPNVDLSGVQADPRRHVKP